MNPKFEIIFVYNLLHINTQLCTTFEMNRRKIKNYDRTKKINFHLYNKILFRKEIMRENIFFIIFG